MEDLRNAPDIQFSNGPMQALLLAFTLLTPALQDAPESGDSISSEQKQAIESLCSPYLEELRERHGAPGLSAALVLPDGATISLTAGFADQESKRVMTPETRLLQGSVGKTYFSAAALHLHFADKLDLDAKVATYLEGVGWYERVPNSAEMTVRQLMRHESGLPRYVFKPAFFERCLAEPDHVWTVEERMSYVFDDPALFEAGQGWGYSDTNYILLGAIIEELAGTTAYEYIEKHLLHPLELIDTIPSDRRRIPGMAQGYARVCKNFGFPERVLEDGVFAFNPQFEWAGGGYASNAVDLARWAHLLYSGAAFEGDYLATLLDTVPSQLGPKKRYGLGVMERETELGPQIGHDGFDPGFTATMGYFPDFEIAAALLINTDAALGRELPLDHVTERLVEIAVEELGL